MKIIGTFGMVVTVSVALLQPAQGRPHGGGGGARSFSGSHFSSAGHFSGRSASFSRGGGGGHYRGGAGYYRGGAGTYRGGQTAYYRGGGRYAHRAGSTAAFRNGAYANRGSRTVATVNRTTALKPGAYSTSGTQRTNARRGAGPAQIGGAGTGGGRIGNGGRVPSNVSSGWDRTRDHVWNGHHCRWYNNAWVIIDPWWGYYPWTWGWWGYPYGYYGDYYYDDGYASGYADYEGDYGDASVRDVQAALARKGYYHGAIDGIFGPATRDSVRQYQLNHGLEATGRIDGPVIGKLGLR